MPTFPEHIAQADAEVRRLERDRDAALAGVRAVSDAAKAQHRQTLTSAEVAEAAALQRAHTAADGALRQARARLTELTRVEAEEAAVTAALNTRGEAVAVTDRPSYDRVMRVGREARTYTPETDRTGSVFLLDLARTTLFGASAPDSHERLARHAAEDRVDHGAYLERAVGTGAFAGLTVPQYLTDLYAPAAAALRPFADACNLHTLPEAGMTVNISRITTTTSVALQASENTAVSEQNMDDTILTESVQTAAGQQTISRQAIERGTGIEEVAIQDLFDQHATRLDLTLISQATTGLSAVAQAFAYTDASPTAAEAHPKILAAVNGVETALLGRGRNLFAVMHPRRWNWFAAATTTAWPWLSNPGVPAQAGGVNYGKTYGSGFRGLLPSNVPVVVDANIATNLGAGTEDEIYVVAQSESHLWEDPNAPMLIRAEQPAAASLGVLFVVYSYFAYSFRRYTNGASKIGGTGLIAPTF